MYIYQHRANKFMSLQWVLLNIIKENTGVNNNLRIA